MFALQCYFRGLVVMTLWGVFSATGARGGQVALAWNANPEPDIAGYRVYFGTNSARYTTVINAGKVTNAVISNLQPDATYYFALTAYNSAALESEFSNEAVAQLSGNQPPTLDAIANVAAPEDSGVFAVTLTGISPGAGETQPLTITARSSNPALLPDPAVSYNPNTGQASLSLQSVKNGFGAAIVTVTVDDQQATSNRVARSFTVTVTPENDPPQLSVIRDQALELGGMPRLVFLSGINSGAPNETDALSIVAASDNPDVIRDPLVFYDSPAFSGVLVLEPAGTNGTANVTVTISDGSTTTARTFAVLVQPANEPPTIAAVPDQTMAESEESEPIPLAIADEKIPAENLVVSASSSDPEVLASEDIVVEGVGANRALKLRHGRGRAGHATITVKVDDGQAISTLSFGVDVVSGSVGAPGVQTATSVDAPTIGEIPPTPLPENLIP